MTNINHGCPTEPNIWKMTGEEGNRYKQAVTIMPNWDKIIEEFKFKIENIKASRKAKNLKDQMLKTINEQAKYLSLYKESKNNLQTDTR